MSIHGVVNRVNNSPLQTTIHYNPSSRESENKSPPPAGTLSKNNIVIQDNPWGLFSELIRHLHKSESEVIIALNQKAEIITKINKFELSLETVEQNPITKKVVNTIFNALTIESKFNIIKQVMKYAFNEATASSETCRKATYEEKTLRTRLYKIFFNKTRE